MNFLYMLEARGDGVFLFCKKTLIRNRFLFLTPNIIPTFDNPQLNESIKTPKMNRHSAPRCGICWPQGRDNLLNLTAFQFFIYLFVS